MREVIRTVLGDVAPDDIGHTQTHEHLLIDLSQPLPASASEADHERDEAPIRLDNYYATRRDHTSHDLRLESVDEAVDELNAYKEVGGSAIVEATSLGLKRDPQGLHEIAKRTGVHIVMGSGYYYRDYHPESINSLNVDTIAESIIGDIAQGVGPGRIRAGIIGEIGMSWPHHNMEMNVLEASVHAQKATGAALLIHPGRHAQSPLEVIRFVDDHGGDVSRVIMSHIDRTLFTAEDIRELAETGCYVEFDLFGQESSYYSLDDSIDMPNDATRVDHLARLISEGYRDQILIAQDICHKTNLRRYGGEGYTHIIDHVLPLMRRKGFSSADISSITIDNPRRALTLHRR